MEDSVSEDAPPGKHHSLGNGQVPHLNSPPSIPSSEQGMRNSTSGSSSNSTPPIATPSLAPNKEGQGTSPPPSGQVTSTSPSSVGRSITSALAAAIPSFNGGFLRSSTSTSPGPEGAPERSSTLDQVQQNSGAKELSKSFQDIHHPSAAENLSTEVTRDGASQPAPSNKPNLPLATMSASTSYLPSPASITSFFSSGSKPKSTSQAANTPLQTTAFPPESVDHAPVPSIPSKALEKETNTLSIEESTSLPAPSGSTGAPLSPRPQSSTSEPPVSDGNFSSAKAVSPAPSGHPASSLTALMNAAAPYLTPSSRKPSKPAVSTGTGPPEKPPPLQQSAGSQGAGSAVKDGGTPASGACSAESTSATDQMPGESPLAADIISHPVSSAADGQPSSSQKGNSSSPSPRVAPPGALPQENPPSCGPQETSPSSPPQVPQPVNSPQTIPLGTSQVPQPATAAQESLPCTSSQAPQPVPSALGTSSGTSYLSLPSFLPSWSTITAQLPSIPSAPFTSKDSEATPGTKALNLGAPPGSSSGAVADSGAGIGPKSDPGQLPVPSSPAAVSKSGLLSQPPRTPATSGSVPVSAARTEPSPAASPSFVPSSSEATGKHTMGVSKPGGKEQEPPRRELDPPGAAAAAEIAAGIAGVFGPVTREADKQVEAALRSQEKLALSIDRLTKGLDKLLEESPQPLVAQQAARLAHIRKRVQSLASTLKVIQGRIDSMNWALDRKSSRAPFSRARSATAPNSPHSYQPGIAPLEQIRQHVAESRAGRGERDHPQLPASWRPDASGSTGMVAQAGSTASISRGGEMADLSRLVQGRPSSKSPDKGHRRAMSHDIRFSTALSSRR